MSTSDAPREPRPVGGGARTAGGGTPVAVEMSADPRARWLIALFVAGPVIWSVHFMLVYVVAEAGCTGEGPGLRLADPPVPTIVTIAATVVAAVACLATAVWAYRWWREERENEADEAGATESILRGKTLAFGGLLLSLLGFVEVLLVGVPALVLPACGP